MPWLASALDAAHGPQPIVINNTNVQKNSGCLGGCGTVFAVALLLGLAVEYWYISVAVAVLAVAAGIWQHQRRHEMPAAAHAPAAVGSSGGAAPALCAGCGAATAATAFCAHCGQPQGKTCAGCGMTGLNSQFCPDCGSATYTPPTPA